jgi:hypothetical protein
MSKENTFGSVENLSSSGRSTSRSSLISSASLDDVLDKLKCLNYQKEFCIPKYAAFIDLAISSLFIDSIFKLLIRILTSNSIFSRRLSIGY